VASQPRYCDSDTDQDETFISQIMKLDDGFFVGRVVRIVWIRLYLAELSNETIKELRIPPELLEICLAYQRLGQSVAMSHDGDGEIDKMIIC